ncbi:MAG: PAS domain-containing protein [Spirochaetota bacterium]
MAKRQLSVDQARVTSLKRLIDRLIQGESIQNDWEQAAPLADTATPQEVMYLVDYVTQKTASIKEAKLIISKVLNLFSKALEHSQIDSNSMYAFEQQMSADNQAFRERLDRMRKLTIAYKQSGDTETFLSNLSEELQSLAAVHDHYVDMENILFPHIEQYVDHSACLQVLWSIHDDVRTTLKSLSALCNNPQSAQATQLHQLLGKLFFSLGTLITREQQILLPAVHEHIPPSVWEKMAADKHGESQEASSRVSDGQIELPTGTLSAQQLMEIFSTIPVDLTLVNAQDEVVFFNTPPHRIFPRSKSVIGRNVRNCHPPESVHVVENILHEFKQKKRNRAEFYLHIQEAYVYIQYIALYTEQGEYDGVLEVLQEISGLQKITGEKRLLDWD